MPASDVGVRTVLREHPGQVVLAVALALLAAATSLLNPLVVRRLVTDLGEHRSLVAPATVLALLVLGGALCAAWSSFLLGRVGELGIMRLRTNIVAHVLRMPLADVRATGSGELIARATNDPAQLRAVIDVGVTTLPVSAIVVVASLIFMATLDWVLLLIVAGTFAVAGIAIGVFVRGVRRGATGQQVAIGGLAARFSAALGSVSTIKANRAEDRAVADVRGSAREAAEAAISADRAQAFISPLMGLGQQAAIIGVIAGSGARLASGSLTAPDFVAFLMYLFQLISPLTVLASGVARLQVGLSALGRIRHVLGLPLEAAGPSTEPALAGVQPVLALRSVSAAYEGEPVLHDVTLDIAPRGVTALVGPSGAGKSTVLGLAERFVLPSSGSVQLHGRDAADWPLAALRRRIAFVDQEFTLLADSVRANLTLGRERPATDEELWTALDEVGMRAAVTALPQGLDTVLGGANDVSGGQRQRLALARALLSEAEVLLLDEPSSQLDGVNERRLIGVLSRLARDRAVVVVAHRLSTVRDAEQIFVLDDGRVAGTGTHAELIRSCAAYGELVQSQTGATGSTAPRRAHAAPGAHRLVVAS